MSEHVDRQLESARDATHQLIAILRLLRDNDINRMWQTLSETDRQTLQLMIICAGSIIGDLVETGDFNETYDAWLARWAIHVATMTGD